MVDSRNLIELDCDKDTTIYDGNILHIISKLTDKTLTNKLNEIIQHVEDNSIYAIYIDAGDRVLDAKLAEDPHSGIYHKLLKLYLPDKTLSSMKFYHSDKNEVIRDIRKFYNQYVNYLAFMIKTKPNIQYSCIHIM